MRRFLRRAALIMAAIAVVGVLVDRVSLTLWRHRMEYLGDQLQKEAKESRIPVGPLLEVRPRRPDIPEKLSVDLFQAGVHADFVTVDERGSLLLIFVPPALAWSTRLYPLRSMYCKIDIPPVSHYVYTLNVWREAQDQQLRISMKAGGP